MDQSYKHVVGKAVSNKWHTHELKQDWYIKFSMARRRKLEELFRRQNSLCIFCSEETWMARPGLNQRNKCEPGQRIKAMATLEHILPQALGGTDRMSNLCMSCLYCNSNRGVLDFEYFKEVRDDPVKWKTHTTKKARKLHQADAERKIKSNVRRNKLIWNLAILFYLHTTFG